MPVTSPQGTLDFKKVDKITFVGASSNTVIDTTTGSVGIGVVGDALSSNLHVVGDTRMEGNINMLHTSNTASIKLNSNVVTEFPRSKKLIKYPRVNLTQNALNNGYAASASTEKDGTSTGQAYRVFDGVLMERGYHSANSSYSSGTYSLSNSITDFYNKIHSGEWIKLQMPTTEKIQLRGFTFHPRGDSGSSGYAPYRIPLEGVFLGSTDGNNWYPIHYFYNFGVTNGEIVPLTKHFEPTNHVYYNHIAVVAYKLQNSTNASVFNFAELELFGIPEYDPEAHGTDVVVKSEANVPNTDWLEVYYDAKGLPTGAVTNPISGLEGTTINGTAHGGVTVSDGAFVFDGTDDYITTSALGFSGDQVHSVSIWFRSDRPQTDMTTENGIYGFGYGNNLSAGLSWWSPVTVPGSSLRFWHDGSAGKNFPGVTFLKNKWNHLVLVYPGGGAFNSRVWLNGVELNGINGGYASGNNYDFNWSTGDTMIIGDWYTTSGPKLQSPWDGKIANFRLFNRALITDEIYQLYAYQKEYFGHSTNSMTLKAGRLGIGTSEPKAALDVRGTINATRFNTLVAEQTIISTVDSVEFTGLDLFGDGGTYKILWKVKNPVGGNPQYYMTVNGDTTESNYWYGGKQHTNQEGLHDGNYPTIFRAGSESAHTLEITMTRSCDGYIVAHGQGNFHTGNNLLHYSVQGWELTRWFYKNPGNVTSILFSSVNSSTGKYGAGSNIQIHRYM